MDKPMYTYEVSVRFTVEQMDFDSHENFGNTRKKFEGIEGTVEASSRTQAWKMVKQTIWAHIGFCWTLTYTQFYLKRVVAGDGIKALDER